ncbi:MAG: hypothetical protein R6V14_06045 [Halanaerobiales bacterium]
MDELKFNIFTNKYTVVILAIFACILWGSAFPSLKVSYSILEIENSGAFIKMLFASYRFLLASFMLFIFIVLKSGIKRLKLARKDYFHLLILGRKSKDPTLF